MHFILIDPFSLRFFGVALMAFLPALSYKYSIFGTDICWLRNILKAGCICELGLGE